ncbi:phage tail sheath C-terminal domain-containing protein [Streptomyces sp. NPDC049577]|uniref:phage tail sheath family protein n=1 Tax=Streptomyces sp. NPDC049577 TaxID=3155153 RepID=UPI00343D4E0F
MAPKAPGLTVPGPYIEELTRAMYEVTPVPTAVTAFIGKFGRPPVSGAPSDPGHTGGQNDTGHKASVKNGKEKKEDNEEDNEEQKTGRPVGHREAVPMSRWVDGFGEFHRWLLSLISSDVARSAAVQVLKRIRFPVEILDGMDWPADVLSWRPSEGRLPGQLAGLEICENIARHFGFFQSGQGSHETVPALSAESLDTLAELVQLEDLPVSDSLVGAVYGFFANGGERCLVVFTGPGDAPYEKPLDVLRHNAEVTIVTAPDDDGHDTLVARKLAEHCAEMGNRMVILHLPGEATAKTATAPNVMPAEYAAVYFPWVTMTVPVNSARTGRPAVITVPPCGHVAGAWAASDRDSGVFYAPANIPLVAADSFTVTLSDKQQEKISQQVNCLRDFPGQGKTIWGARTLDPDVNRRYVNVRRLMNFLEASIKASTRWAVFQPVDQHLWGALRGQVGSFLHDQWLSGALRGDVASDAFRVVCDASNNPAGSIAAGKVIVDIAVAPVRPAEFILFRITQTAGSVALLAHPNA